MRNRNFRGLLQAKWDEGRFVCVGLDSEFGKIPECLRMASVPNAILTFNRAIVDATYDLVGVYKPNIAFYEAQGDEGLAALQLSIRHIHKVAPNVPVILDAKRADIGNTNNGYVEMAFGYLDADAITVHPYMGQKSLQPFLDRSDKSIFVLCRTSNPGAGEFQDIKVALTFSELVELVGDADLANDLNGKMGWSCATGGYRVPMYQFVALRVSRHWNANGNCGLVVGATAPTELAEVRKLVGDDMPILVPGIGKQGGDLEASLKAGVGKNGQGVIINSSSGIIFASNGADFAKVARQETQKLHDEIGECLAV